MKILALDSSGLVASAAVVEDDVLIAEYTTDYKNTFPDITSDVGRDPADDRPGSSHH